MFLIYSFKLAFLNLKKIHPLGTIILLPFRKIQIFLPVFKCRSNYINYIFNYCVMFINFINFKTFRRGYKKYKSFKLKQKRCWFRNFSFIFCFFFIFHDIYKSKICFTVLTFILRKFSIRFTEYPFKNESFVRYLSFLTVSLFFLLVMGQI